ncbi:MAG: NAD-dependent epimerase/dehydratase family protein [Bacteroidetes bacterium]|nr:NAD-dependent epimerase/dehydratase family protein [Bacteroidota bacterium]
MKILVTGGSGYLGSIIVPTLLKEGHSVTVVDNFMYNQVSLLDCCNDPALNIVRADARDKAIIKEHISQSDAIIPLACLTGAPLCDQDPEGARSIILDAVKLILELRSKNQAVIYPTTNSGYGIGEKGIHCTEDTPLRPVSLYGKLKVEAENEVLNAGGSITLRLATAFGISPRMRLDLLVNDFVYRAVNDRFVVLFEAHFKRNFIHVRDVAKAFLHMITNFDQVKNY